MKTYVSILLCMTLCVFVCKTVISMSTYFEIYTFVCEGVYNGH